MALTDKLGIVANCYPHPDGQPDVGLLKFADDLLFKKIRHRSMRFPKGATLLLDIGSGDKGSDFVNRYGAEFPKTAVVYLDFSRHILEELDRPNRVCANAAQMPFLDESFDIAYAGHVINEGVVKHHWFSRDTPFWIAKEAYRVLRPGGLFVFTQVNVGSPDAETLTNLFLMGFRNLMHLQRISSYYGISTDTYAARKLVGIKPF